MDRKAWVAVWAALAAVVLASAAVAAKPEEGARMEKGEKGRVILRWETYQELIKEKKVIEKEPKLTLPWPEVESLLGVKIEKLEGPEMVVTWRQFRALLEWSLLKKKPKKVVTPADYVISSADFSGTLHEEGAVFDLEMKINVLKAEGWKRIGILPTTVAVESADLPENCYLHATGERYEILTTGAGPIEAKLRFAAAVAEKAGMFQVDFATVSSGACTLKLTVPEKKVKVTVTGAQVVLPLKGSSAATVVGASLPSGARVRIGWERALEKVEKAPPKLYASTNTLVAVGDGSLTCREKVNLSVLHSGVRSASLILPAGVSVLEVSGPAVHDWRVVGGKMEVRFAHEVVGHTWVNVVYEYTTSDAKASAPAPILHVVDVVREKGTIGIVALANVEVTASKHPGATSIDVRELPAEILQMTSQPLLLAFRYLGRTPAISLAVKKHEDVRVLLTIADSAMMTVMQTMDGKRITKVVYNMRNNRNQFLRVRLPAGAEVWTATVAGKSIRPARDAAGQVLIPLVRSARAQAELAAFPVELVYVEKQGSPGEKGKMRIDLPRSAEPMTHLMVQLYLPAEGNYRRGLLREMSFEGPLRLVERYSVVRGAPRPVRAEVKPEVQAMQLQKQYRRRIEVGAVAAGVTPIHVRLPIRGQRFQFEKILVLDEPLWISFEYSGWEED